MQSTIVVCDGCKAKNRVVAVKQHLDPKCGRCGEALSLTGKIVPIELDDASMDSFIHSVDLPILVDFYSPTCGPCKVLSPILDELTTEFFKRVIVAKVNATLNPGCAAFYKVQGVPTLIFFRNGDVVERVTGLIDRQQLQAKLRYFSGG